MNGRCEKRECWKWIGVKGEDRRGGERRRENGKERIERRKSGDRENGEKRAARERE